MNTDIWEIDSQHDDDWLNQHKSVFLLGSTVHPQINGKSYGDEYGSSGGDGTNNLVDKNNQDIHIIDAQESFIMPLNIYFKPNCQSKGSTTTITRSQEPLLRYKTIRIMTQPENKARQFDFTLRFNLKRHKKYINTNGGGIDPYGYQ